MPLPPTPCSRPITGQLSFKLCALRKIFWMSALNSVSRAPLPCALIAHQSSLHSPYHTVGILLFPHCCQELPEVLVLPEQAQGLVHESQAPHSRSRDI